MIAPAPEIPDCFRWTLAATALSYVNEWVWTTVGAPTGLIGFTQLLVVGGVLWYVHSLQRVVERRARHHHA